VLQRVWSSNSINAAEFRSGYQDAVSESFAFGLRLVGLRSSFGMYSVQMRINTRQLVNTAK
jgi:hypothetical protein